MQVPDAQQPLADQDINKVDRCPKDEDFVVRPDAATMDEAITWFMDCMEAQECCGFKDLHGLLERLPVPTVKPGQYSQNRFILNKLTRLPRSTTYLPRRNEPVNNALQSSSEWSEHWCDLPPPHAD